MLPMVKKIEYQHCTKCDKFILIVCNMGTGLDFFGKRTMAAHYFLRWKLVDISVLSYQGDELSVAYYLVCIILQAASRFYFLSVEF